MNVLAKIARWFRERRIIRKCGCICWCPVCKDPLNDQSGLGASSMHINEIVHMRCQECGTESRWIFDAPVPIMIWHEQQLGREVQP